MADFKILTDSCCDLPPKLAQELELDVFPMTFVLEGREYQHHLDHRKMDNHKFYEGLRAGAAATTVAVNPAEWTAMARPYLERGQDIQMCIRDRSAAELQDTAQAVCSHYRAI